MDDSNRYKVMMADTVDTQTRSRMMSAVKGKNTTPEMFIRSYLHKAGIRFRLHRKDLPGTPDLVLPKFRLVIFVHGCFWHQHQDCYYATLPSSNEEFWKSKLQRNHQRDKQQTEQLLILGWRVLTVWECGLKHSKDELDELLKLIKTQEALMFWPDTPPRIKQ